MIRHFKFRLAVLALATACAFAMGAGQAAAEPAASDWARTDHSEVRLVAAVNAVGQAESVRLGVQFRLKPGWKTYWRSPGDAGFPVRVDWTGSRNLGSADLRWPAPERFELFGLDTFGYGGEVVFPVDLKPARRGEATALRATVDYLVCEKICIPYTARLALDLPAGPAAASNFAHLIDRFAARVPGDGSTHGLNITRAEFHDGASPEFLVFAQALRRFEAPVVFVEGANGWSFARPTPSFSEGGTQAILRVPARRDGSNAVALSNADVTLTLVDGDRAAERRIAITPGAASAQGTMSFAAILALALLGGLILNLMPCVLPVLSLKLLNLVGHGGAPPAKLRASFLATAAGIVAAFLALAGALVALKSAGHAIGWGIQFQQPVFLALMGLVLTLFAANLWGLLEIRLPTAINDIIARALPGTAHGDSLAGAFVTGAFATLLATPCSAPFVGTAIGFALARGPAEIFAIFAALGVGLALPYLAIATFPKLVSWLPRPGRWMGYLRAALGFALMATVLWLGSVLAAQLGTDGALVYIAIAIVLLGVLWLERRLDEGRAWVRLVSLAPFLALAALLPHRFLPPASSFANASDSHAWQTFDRAAIDAAVRDGRVVFVDVTADWCVTCQVNKSLVLKRGEVAQRLAAPDIVAMRADWTRPDARIADYLASFGRYGIPFNAVYGPGAPGGLPLPELLSADAVLAAIDQAARKRTASP